MGFDKQIRLWNPEQSSRRGELSAAVAAILIFSLHLVSFPTSCLPFSPPAPFPMTSNQKRSKKNWMPPGR